MAYVIRYVTTITGFIKSEVLLMNHPSRYRNNYNLKWKPVAKYKVHKDYQQKASRAAAGRGTKIYIDISTC